MKSKKMTQLAWVKENYVKPVALSNAERQRNYKVKLKQDGLDKYHILFDLNKLLKQSYIMPISDRGAVFELALQNLLKKFDPDYDDIPFD